MNILCKDFDAASYWRFDLPFSFQLGDVIQKCTKPLLLQNVIKFLFYPGKKAFLKLILEDARTAKRKFSLWKLTINEQRVTLQLAEKKQKETNASFLFFLLISLSSVLLLDSWQGSVFGVADFRKKETTACFHFVFSCSYISRRILFWVFSWTFGRALFLALT